MLKKWLNFVCKTTRGLPGLADEGSPSDFKLSEDYDWLPDAELERKPGARDAILLPPNVTCARRLKRKRER
jgi:hypothetical protein